jgi:hypothetical protein
MATTLHESLTARFPAAGPALRTPKSLVYYHLGHNLAVPDVSALAAALNVADASIVPAAAAVQGALAQALEYCKAVVRAANKAAAQDTLRN